MIIYNYSEIDGVEIKYPSDMINIISKKYGNNIPKFSRFILDDNDISNEDKFKFIDNYLLKYMDSYKYREDCNIKFGVIYENKFIGFFLDPYNLLISKNKSFKCFRISEHEWENKKEGIKYFCCNMEYLYIFIILLLISTYLFGKN